MANQKQLVDRIKAQDADGNVYDMVQYQTMISSTEVSSGRTRWAKGTTEWFLVHRGAHIDAESSDDINFRTMDGLKLTKVD